MTVRLLWRTTANDVHRHGWTGDRECGWPYAMCGYGCPDDEIADAEHGDKLCPRCVYYATARGFTVPPGEVCPHSGAGFWRWLCADWQRIARACVLLTSLAALAVVPVLVMLAD